MTLYFCENPKCEWGKRYKESGIKKLFRIIGGEKDDGVLYCPKCGKKEYVLYQSPGRAGI